MSNAYFQSDYRTSSISKIREQIEYCMTHDLKQDIFERMDQEAKSFDLFLKRLIEDIEELREKDS